VRPDATGHATASVRHRTASRGKPTAGPHRLGCALAQSVPPQRRRRAGYAYATHSAVGPWAGGRLHGRDDALLEPRGVDVGRHAIASVGHLTTGPPRMESRGIARPDDCIGRWRSLGPAGVARRICVSEERSVRSPQGARSTTMRRPARARFGRRISQAGPAPQSGDGIGVWFSESGIESLVRPGGWRRLRRFAGSTGASNVAFRGITPDPTAIQAVAGSAVDAGPVGGLAQSTKPTS